MNVSAPRISLPSRFLRMASDGLEKHAQRSAFQLILSRDDKGHPFPSRVRSSSTSVPRIERTPMET
jgi:hypothetical protein